MNGFQTFDIRGGEALIGAAGNFIRFDSDHGMPIKVRGDGQDLAQLWPGESMELGHAVNTWTIVADAGEVGRVRIGFGRIAAPSLPAPVLVMETDAAQVAVGAGPGWVSGSIAGLAASATGNILFDLGPDWRKYGMLDLSVLLAGPSSGLNPVRFFGSDDDSLNAARKRGSPFATGATVYSANLVTANGAQMFTMRPAGRYFWAVVTNADAANAQGPAAKITLVAFPS